MPSFTAVGLYCGTTPSKSAYELFSPPRKFAHWSEYIGLTASNIKSIFLLGILVTVRLIPDSKSLTSWFLDLYWTHFLVYLIPFNGPFPCLHVNSFYRRLAQISGHHATIPVDCTGNFFLHKHNQQVYLTNGHLCFFLRKFLNLITVYWWTFTKAPHYNVFSWVYSQGRIMNFGPGDYHFELIDGPLTV